MSSLNDKQDRFCLEFIIDLNATNAAKRAGYSPKTAHAQSSRLLKDVKVQSRIKDLMKKRQKRMEISGDAVVQRLANIAFGDLGMICTWTDSGLDLIESSELDDNARAIIQEISIKPVSGGEGMVIGYDKKVKMKDSLKALEMLSKHLGLLDGSGASTKDNSAIKSKLSTILENFSKRKQ